MTICQKGVLGKRVRKEIERLCQIKINDLTNGERSMLEHYLEWYPEIVIQIIDSIIAKRKK